MMFASCFLLGKISPLNWEINLLSSSDYVEAHEKSCLALPQTESRWKFHAPRAFDLSALKGKECSTQQPTAFPVRTAGPLKTLLVKDTKKTRQSCHTKLTLAAFAARSNPLGSKPEPEYPASPLPFLSSLSSPFEVGLVEPTAWSRVA